MRDRVRRQRLDRDPRLPLPEVRSVVHADAGRRVMSDDIGAVVTCGFCQHTETARRDQWWLAAEVAIAEAVSRLLLHIRRTHYA